MRTNKMRTKRTVLQPEQADALLEKYYEGMTTVAEEHQLVVFLSQENLPQRFEADRALLSYFAGTKKVVKQKVMITPFIRWSSVAATLLLGLFLAKAFISEKPVNYAYINGQKCTDINVVKEKALASLQVIISAPNEVKASAGHLNDDALVEQQLSQLIGR